MNTLNKELQMLIKEKEEQLIPICNQDIWRLHYHLMPPIGWLNDPNGLCYFLGRYHVFFQYSPFDVKSGLKVWGHYTSPDMIHWAYEGVPLCPDQSFDCHGVYSGSALAEEDKLTLFYTGNVKLTGDYDYIVNGREANTISVESLDGFSFANKECLMKNQDYPSDLTCHVRDPKVWKENNSYYMVQGARNSENVGEVLLFQSEDKKEWAFINRIKSTQSFGYMWECPDLFRLENQWILSVSPQGVLPLGNEFQNIYQSGYYFLDGDIKKEYKLSCFRELDRGFDYYAPQSFLGPDGRRIQIGWMGLPDLDGVYQNPTQKNGWQHALTLPRELSLRNGKLIQKPIRELQQLRKLPRSFEMKRDPLILPIDGCFELLLNMKTDQKTDVKLILDQGVQMNYNSVNEEFQLLFLNSIGCNRTQRKVSLDALKSIQVFIDSSSIEIFLNEGEEVFTSRFYPKTQKHSMTIIAADASVTVWGIKVP